MLYSEVDQLRLLVAAPASDAFEGSTLTSAISLFEHQQMLQHSGSTRTKQGTSSKVAHAEIIEHSLFYEHILKLHKL